MSANVCQVCNVRSIAHYNKKDKKYVDIPVRNLKGTVVFDGLIFCSSCWCKKHNGPKPCYNSICFICHQKKKN